MIVVVPMDQNTIVSNVVVNTVALPAQLQYKLLMYLKNKNVNSFTYNITI